MCKHVSTKVLFWSIARNDAKNSVAENKTVSTPLRFLPLSWSSSFQQPLVILVSRAVVSKTIPTTTLATPLTLTLYFLIINIYYKWNRAAVTCCASAACALSLVTSQRFLVLFLDRQIFDFLSRAKLLSRFSKQL